MALMVIAVVALLGVNLYVQSPRTQARIQSELSKALNLPLVITNASLSPWGDLRINGITVPSETGNFLEASSFSARYRLLPLLRKQLIIYDMRVESPKIVWLQNANGKWVVPSLAQAPAHAAGEKEKRRAKKENDFEVVLDGFQAQGGFVEFIDRDNRRVALLTDVNMQYSVLSRDRVEGAVSIGRVAYANWLVMENVRSPFKYSGGEFVLPAIEAMAGGGPVNGNFQLSPEGKQSLFSAHLDFEAVDAARLAADGGSAPGHISGTLRGKVDVRGSSREVARMEGKGRVEATNGQFRQLELLQTLGQVLQIEELANLRLKDGVADFHIADEKVFVDSLVLESPDLRLSAQGYARFDGKLSLDARLALDSRNLNRTPSIVRDLFTATDTSGESAVDFKVFGKVNNPKTDIAEKVIGKRLGDQFESFVSGLFGSKKKKSDKKKEDKKKKVEESSPPPAEVAPEPQPSSPIGRPVPPSAPANATPGGQAQTSDLSRPNVSAKG